MHPTATPRPSVRSSRLQSALNSNQRTRRRSAAKALFFGAAPSWPSDVAALKGAHFLQVDLWDGVSPYPKPAATWHNTAAQTSWRQLAALERLRRTLQQYPRLQQLPLASACLESLALQSQNGRVPWVPTTFFRELTNLDGAMSTLGKYSTNIDFGLRLTDATTWRTAKTAWQRESLVSQPVGQAAATAEDIALAISRTKDQPTAVHVMLLWLMCGRKGDIAKLRANDVTLHPDGRLTFFVQEGKGVLARRGKYHVASHCPTQWRQQLQAYLQQPHPTGYLFPARFRSPTNNEVLQALRVANPALNCRSVRRGGLQAIALKGDVTEEILMRMSGHRSVATLHRYLEWDKSNELMHSRAQEAARALTDSLAQDRRRQDQQQPQQQQEQPPPPLPPPQQH